jgi:hypothetical protein
VVLASWPVENPFVAFWLLPAALLLGLFGVVLAIGWLAWAWPRGRAFRGLGMVGAVTTVLYLYYFTSLPGLAGIYVKFFLNLPRYERTVAALEQDSGPRVRARHPEWHDVEVDAGPPLRVAFNWGGMVDNWTGIVYDPTHEVLKAREFRSDWSNWDDPRLAKVKALFGGDLFRVRHLYGPWFICSFT